MPRHAFASITGYLLASAIVLAAGSTATAGCLHDIYPSIKQINEKIRAIDRSLPKDFGGEQVPSGQCVIRALRMGLIFGTTKTYPTLKDGEDASACLEIEKFFLYQSCTCQKMGQVLDTSEETEKAITQQYKEIKKIETKVRKAGIKNPAIREFVRMASSARECYSLQTLKQLEQIELEVSKIAGP